MGEKSEKRGRVRRVCTGEGGDGCGESTWMWRVRPRDHGCYLDRIDKGERGVELLLPDERAGRRAPGDKVARPRVGVGAIVLCRGGSRSGVGPRSVGGVGQSHTRRDTGIQACGHAQKHAIGMAFADPAADE